MKTIDTKKYRDCGTTGRAELIERVEELCAALDLLREEHQVATELLRQELDLTTGTGFSTALDLLREQHRVGLNLPGWFCSACRVFNGEAREVRESCRCCDARRETP